MNIIYTFTDKQIAQLFELYQHEWWSSGRTLTETHKGINGSQICIGIIDDNEDLKGFVRVLTDYIYKALIFDVIVAQDQRGNGLGDQLVGLVLSHPSLKDVKHIELYCLPELIPFYEQYGFSSNTGNIRLMRRVLI